MRRQPHNAESLDVCTSVLSSMKQLYQMHMLPMEKKYSFNNFFSPLLSDGDFDARPMVLLLGQYSTGKSTFVRYVLERDYAGSIIGPEPTTDRFTAVEYGSSDQVVFGNAATADKASPFYPLTEFGNDFLSRFVVAQSSAPVLKGMTIIDTPGILSGSKQTSRGYEFENVVKWFAERSDLILLFFDAYKLDISDEFRRCINVLKSHESKIRILLNKADMVTNRQLLRIFGALMWSLGKVINSPEVVRIYVGSFWDQPLQNDENRKLFEDEENELFNDIALLPKSCSLRKLNDFVKRIRLLKAHVVLLSHLKKQIPIFGKESKKRQMLAGISDVLDMLSKEHSIARGDFPPIDILKAKLEAYDLGSVPKLDNKWVASLENVLHNNMPTYMNNLMELADAQTFKDQAGTLMQVDETPFFKLKGNNKENFDLMETLKKPIDVEKYRKDFESLPLDGQNRLIGSCAKDDLIKSKLSAAVLHRIWNLADLTHDGYLDLYEYSLARHLIEIKLKGADLPTTLPDILRYPPRYYT